jgi:hypothetical protein
LEIYKYYNPNSETKIEASKPVEKSTENAGLQIHHNEPKASSLTGHSPIQNSKLEPHSTATHNEKDTANHHSQ